MAISTARLACSKRSLACLRKLKDSMIFCWISDCLSALIIGTTILLNSSLLIAVRIVPLHPFLSCSCSTQLFKKTSKVSELSTSDLTVWNPVEHNALSYSSVIKAMLSSEPSIAELGRIKTGVHTPEILPVATWIIIAQLLSDRNEFLSPKAWKGGSHYIHCHRDEPVNCRSVDK